ncbi:hypothetical protein ACTHHL_16265 [Aeribacillus composti]|uniref:hypothetical protein n=1 Tax=Aeribacillus TaxID=1055323 RepID=UPI00119A07A6|nr:hypothetical protein [Aeribacillus composti]MED0716865.1 hypothetical protein [Aeribacillus composti]TVZ75435.1 hypothetical protein FB379_15610 [Aeribacillus composti]BBU38102.1 hypothetical protein APP_03940 [Aeribacillus pallidus]
MKGKLKKLTISTALLVGVIALPITASAYSKSYTFSMTHGFDGTTVFSLKNAKASTTVKADTYKANGSIDSNKSKYSVALYGGFFNYYSSGDISANGYTYTKSYGTVAKRDYILRLSKTSSIGYRVKGSGTINQ